MFTGRNEELNKLNELYKSEKFEFVVIYGRRRVGKTTLIKEFIKDKKSIYFFSREADGGVNLNNFSNDIYAVTAPEQKGKSFFTDWERALAYIYEISKKERVVLAIDEYPYLANGYHPISSVIQAHIDEQFNNSKLFLILCGSSMSFMETQVLGYKSPLYGRRTAQFLVQSFTFFESLPFLEGYTPEEQAVLYGVTGGIPEYLNRINPAVTVYENIIDLYFTPSGHLFEEPANLLKQELREPATYNGIIEAIAGGATRLSDISNKCGIESNKCAKYLKSLISLGIVRKEAPITELVLSKKSIYLLDDMMFRFWYRFVFPNLSSIVSGLGQQVFEQEIIKEIPAYMGIVFEDICKQYIIKQAKMNGTPLLPGRIGRWWGSNPKEKRQEEIDILTYRKDDALFCECKWTNSPVDTDVLHTLKQRSELLPYKNKWYWIFAKTGFTKLLTAAVREDERVRLITLCEMIPII